jgi:RNA polymerase sigma-70 factor, ECF subfamily
MKFGISKKLTEQELTEQCKAHNKRAQHMLYEMYAPCAKGICYRYVLCMQTAEDITHECFIKIFAQIQTFTCKGEGSLKAWISRIIINMSLDYIKNNKKQTIAHEEHILQLTSDDTDNDDLYSLFETVKQKEISKDDLMQMLEYLPETNRLVFNLYAIDQLKHKEIADILNISEENSRTRLKRARIQLKEQLAVFCNYVPKPVNV